MMIWRVCSPRQGAHDASLSHLLETARGDEHSAARASDFTPLLQAKTSPRRRGSIASTPAAP
ncbi:hypothetical protein [Edwardsiella tarda]|uniref:hypothetical protein n=1 Tax=Edwardsiella tarda TaxID=636 RepID=UPI00351C164F